jgi:hypothetical protein
MTPRRIGSHSLREFPLDVVRVECPQCHRTGSYRLDGLIARFGPDVALPDILMELATCERKDFSRRCSAQYTDLARGLMPLRY